MYDNRLFTKALIYAADKHKDQTRRGGIPYIYHPIKVAEFVKEAGFGIEYQIVALLHDTLEDTDATVDEIREFGEDILIAVQLLTRPDGANENEYIDAILQNHLAAVVKNADKICNLYEACDCEDKEWAAGYVEKSKKYYEKRFSSALDTQLNSSNHVIQGISSKKEGYDFKKKDIVLYLDEEKNAEENERKMYEDGKAVYEKNVDVPDYNHPEIRFLDPHIIVSEGGYDKVRIIYCLIDDHAWMLSRMGWISIDSKIIKDNLMYYPFDYQEVTKEYVLDMIESRFKNGYFYDYVDISRVM